MSHDVLTHPDGRDPLRPSSNISTHWRMCRKQLVSRMGQQNIMPMSLLAELR